MKKIVSIVLAVAFLLGLAVTAVAASGLLSRASLSVDTSVVEAGDKVTVTVTMDEATLLDENATMIQIELAYDQNAMTYESCSLGSGYNFLTVVNSSDAPVIKINWIDINAFDVDSLVENGGDLTPDRIAKNLPAGTIASVTFTVNEGTDVSELQCSLTKSAIVDASGVTISDLSGSITVKVCAGHDDKNDDGICDECGEPIYLLGDVNGDGAVDVFDALMALDFATGALAEGAEFNQEAADVNNDGAVDVFDALIMLDYATGAITEWP